MNDNVRSLPGVRLHTGEPNPALVALCRKLLESAESGELQSLLGTGFTREGQRVAVWADAHDNVYEMLGAIAWLQHEYVEKHTKPEPRSGP